MNAQRQIDTKIERELSSIQGGDAADCGVGVAVITVAFDKRVVGFVVDGDALVDGGAGAKFAADVPFLRRRDLPSREDGVQRFRCL